MEVWGSCGASYAGADAAIFGREGKGEYFGGARTLDSLGQLRLYKPGGVCWAESEVLFC